MLFCRLQLWQAALAIALVLCHAGQASSADKSWETTPQSRQALDRGLQWLAQNQGPEGNWTTNHLALVSMGVLAFLADGHTPGRGKYGDTSRAALNYILTSAKPSGLLNINVSHHDMYNHGLSTFVLGQAYGMADDPRLGPTLERALKLITQCQCRDGGWDYEAHPKYEGHDLSLAVMQAKALRSAVDSGFEVPPAVIEAAIRDVREHYVPEGCRREDPEEEQQKHPGRFCYSKGGGQPTLAMAAAGVVCLQEFAQNDDWRIGKNIEVIEKAINDISRGNPKEPPFDPYTMYYVAQALYQVGGEPWKRCYPILRDRIVTSQLGSSNGDNNPAQSSIETRGGWHSAGQVGGKPGMLYATAVSCFVLAIPNRYLPILQEGKNETLRKQLKIADEAKKP